MPVGRNRRGPGIGSPQGTGDGRTAGINVGRIGDPTFTDPLWREIQDSLEAIRAVRDDVLKFTYEKLG